ncbi:MAG: FGGY family carbohydrate kinase, partial [Bacteroidia bacterium]|nr:FGGY family carbohydrate kinase [Bacteroidia bacterium]
MSPLLLAIDEGTSSARAIVFNTKGEILGLGRRVINLYYPASGWVEQEPEEIWEAQYEAVQEALKSASISVKQIAAIGLTNQRETTICWDPLTGKAYTRAIVWQDRRTADFCRSLALHTHSIRQKTGLLPDPYFSGSKINWMLREGGVPPNAYFGTVDSWLLYKMTRKFLTDVSNASRTLLFNLHTLDWDQELLSLFGVQRENLPLVQPSASFFGETSCWGHKTPICAVLGDQQAALYGHSAHKPGEAKNTYGTGCFILKNIGTHPLPAPEGLLTTVAWQISNQPAVYAWEASIFNAAAALQWLEKIGILRDYAELDTIIDEKENEVCFVPAFTGLGAPYWDPDARGLLIGLTRQTDRKDILRAALEATAYQSAEAIRIFEGISA